MIDIEELAYRETPLGALVLRRRSEPLLGGKVLTEVKLGDEFLMSSLFTASEVALAELGLAACTEPTLDVVVGGLGLGYTAATVLDEPRVQSLLVVEALADVIAWHEQGLVELGPKITGDARCRLVNGDFFALADAAGEGFDGESPGRRFDAILVDIDHSPRHHLDAGNQGFYEPEGLAQIRAHLRPGGVFGLWSNDPPEADFTERLAGVFAHADAHVVGFPNPYTGEDAACTVYLARD